MAIFAIIIIGVSSVEAKELTLGDRWFLLTDALKEAETKQYFYAKTKQAEAHRIYENNFKQAAQELDPETDRIIEEAFSYRDNHIKTRDLAEAGYIRQAIDKSIYKIAFMKVDQALKKGDSEQFLSWFTVLEKKFVISEKPSLVTNKALPEIQQDKNKIYQYRDKIRQEILEIFKLKTIEEIEEAIAASSQGKTADAIKFTYEGYYYYRTYHPVLAKIDKNDAEMVKTAMYDSMRMTRSGMPSEMVKSKLEQILHQIEPAVMGTKGKSGAGLALNGIKDRLVLVQDEYKAAVSNGKIIDKVEYDETIIFLAKAQSILDDNRNDLTIFDDNEITKLESNLDKIKETVDSFDDPVKVELLVSDSIAIISKLSAKTTIALPTAEDYVSQIKQLLSDTKEQYQSGNKQAAFDLASQAYLDNYEFIEKDLALHDKELMEEIEIMMRQDLRDMIKQEASPSEIVSHVDLILEKISKAESLLLENFVISQENIPSPLHQVNTGTNPEEIECGNDKQLVIRKTTGTPACVSPANASRLLLAGWTSLSTY